MRSNMRLWILTAGLCALAGAAAGAGHAPDAGAVVLDGLPADLDWWNGCGPTTGAMLFGYWEEHGFDSFPGRHRDLPAGYPNTSSNPADFADARGVIASWAHRQAGIDLGYSYGSYRNHYPDCIADWMTVNNGGTTYGAIAEGIENFALWDDPDTPEIESRRFEVTTSSSLTPSYGDYCAEIDAGRPVPITLDGDGSGHAVLGVGYNNTQGRQDIVLLTTWAWGVQQWPWENEPYSGHSFSVDRLILVEPQQVQTPELSGYCLVLNERAKYWLSVEMGIGDPDSPTWSSTVWESGQTIWTENLILSDLDLSGALPYVTAGPCDWFMKVESTGNIFETTVLDFQVRYKFDEQVFGYAGAPVTLDGLGDVVVNLTTPIIPEPATTVLVAIGWAALRLRRRRGQTS